MKKLVSMLLVLCLVLCSVTMVALADDSDTVTYEITDENMVLLEKFKADPSSVSFDELSQAMNEDIVFAAEACKVLDSISVCLDDSDMSVDVQDNTAESYALEDSVPDLCAHDFDTGDTYAGLLDFPSNTKAADSDEYYPSRINRYNWTEGMCRIFAMFDNGVFGWSSGFRVGPHWVMTCAHAFYTLVDLRHVWQDENGNINEELDLCNHTFAEQVPEVVRFLLNVLLLFLSRVLLVRQNRYQTFCLVLGLQSLSSLQYYIS